MQLYTTIFLTTFLILASVAFAQSTVTENAITAGGKSITAGATPDSPFYFLDTALDQIRLLLTFDNTAKAKLGLEIARERLLEVREMVVQNKLEAATRAQQEHLNSLEVAKNSASAISRVNATEEIEDEIEIEKELEEHEEEVEEIRNELKIKIEIKGNVTAKQQKLIDSVLSFMQNKTGEVKIKIDEKKGETKIKIKQITGLNETEVEREVKRIEVREKVFEIKSKRALERIEDAVEEIAEVKAKLAGLNATQFNLTAVNVLLEQAEIHSNNSQNAFNETKFGEAFGQATAAKNLAKNANRLLEKVLEKEEELEVKVEIEKGVAEVEVETDQQEFRFKLNTTDRETIVSEIVERTGLTRDKVESILKIKTEKVKSKIIERLETNLEKKEKELEERVERKIEEKQKRECESDDDCANKIVCPQVVGSDTPVCRNNVCTCGSRPAEKAVRPASAESKRVGIENKED